MILILPAKVDWMKTMWLSDYRNESFSQWLIHLFSHLISAVGGWWSSAPQKHGNSLPTKRMLSSMIWLMLHYVWKRNRRMHVLCLSEFWERHRLWKEFCKIPWLTRNAMYSSFSLCCFFKIKLNVNDITEMNPADCHVQLERLQLTSPHKEYLWVLR